MESFAITVILDQKEATEISMLRELRHFSNEAAHQDFVVKGLIRIRVSNHMSRMTQLLGSV